MKKTMKTIIALCLTVAMLSSLFAGVTLAAEPIYVDWFGFETEQFSALVGEETFRSPTPVFFPSNATEKELVWSIDGEAATINESTGLVTLVEAGDVEVIATLASDGTKKASYKLTIEAGSLNVGSTDLTLQIPETKTIKVSGAAGSVTASTSDKNVATVSVDGEYVDITSVAQGYAEIIVTDGVDEPRTIRVNVLPSNVQSAYGSLFGPDGYYRNKTDKEKVPAPLFWYLEALSVSNILAPGQTIAPEKYIKPTYEENHSDTVNPYFTVNGENRAHKGDKKIWFYPFRYELQGEETEAELYQKHNAPGLYSSLNFADMSVSTIDPYYEIFAIEMPKKGTVRVSSSIALTLPKTVREFNTDGIYMAIFTMNDENEITRVFPAQTEGETTAANTKAEVLDKWLWVYPEKWKNGDKGNSCDHVFDEAFDKPRLEKFNAEGAEFTVEAGDIVRVVLHAGENQNSDSGFKMNPVIEYVEYPVESVSNLETEIEIVQGETTTLSARINPYHLEAPIMFSVLDDEKVYGVAESGASGLKVKVDSQKYSTEEGKVGDFDFTLSAAADSAIGTGYYRLKFGDHTRLIAVTVTASASDEGDVEDDTSEVGNKVVLGQGGSSGEGGTGGDGGDTDDGDDNTPVFKFTFNEVPSGMAVSAPSTPSAIIGKFTWKYTNNNSTAQDYFLLMLYGTRDGSDINLSALPTVGIKKASATANVNEFSDSYKGDFTPDKTLFPAGSGKADLFWFYGDYDNLAKNGMTLIGQCLNFTR